MNQTQAHWDLNTDSRIKSTLESSGNGAQNIHEYRERSRALKAFWYLATLVGVKIINLYYQ